MSENLTEVIFIIDHSGSMSGLEKDVVGGFNTTIKEQRKNADKCLVSTVFFNDHSEVIHDRLDLNEIKEMGEDDYKAYGSTALVDALGDSIKYIKKVHKIIRKEDVPTHTMFVITTDGYENASTKYSSKEVKKMIEEQQEKGWEFIYLAANIDAVETGKEFGFKESHSHNFVCDGVGNQVAYETVSNCMSMMRRADKDTDMEECFKKSGVFAKLDSDYKKRRK